jgi:hypothetical protein
MKIIHQFIGFLLLIMLIGCSTKESGTTDPIFVDIQGLNESIKLRVGIDISIQKQKADSVFKLDDQFYLKLIEEMSGAIDSDCFNRAKIDEKPIDLNGNQIINFQSYDSLGVVMMDCFAKNMLMSGCSKKSLDTLCIIKNNWFYHMSGESEAQFGYRFFFSGLYELYTNKYLTIDEFHYTLLYLHYMGVFNGRPRENEAYKTP